MVVKMEMRLSSFEPWAGGVDLFNRLEDMDLLDDLEQFLKEVYPEGIDETELNALLWREADWIFENLGIAEEEEEEEEEWEE